jgi:hypothetical protein
LGFFPDSKFSKPKTVFRNIFNEKILTLKGSWDQASMDDPINFFAKEKNDLV